MENENLTQVSTCVKGHGSSEPHNQKCTFRHAPCLIRIFTGRILNIQECKVSPCGQQRLTSREHAYIRLTPLNLTFYIVKLGFTGGIHYFLISTQKHRLWVLVRTASPRRFKRVSTIYVFSRNVKSIRIFI